MIIKGLGFVDGDFVIVCNNNTVHCVNVKTGSWERSTVGEHKKGYAYLDIATYNNIKRRCTRKVCININGAG